MGRPRVFWTVVGLLLAGTVALAVVLRGEERAGAERSLRSPAAPAPASASAAATAAAAATRVVLVRRRGGVPAAWRARVARVPGVTAVTRATRGQALLRRAATRAGRTVTEAPPGHAVPLDVLGVAPRGYAAAVLRGEDAATLRRVGPGRVVLSQSSARLRRLGPGGRLSLAGGRTLRVVGVLPDPAVRSAELVVGPADAARLGTANAFLLAATTDPGALVRRFDARSGAGRGDRRAAATPLDPGGASPPARGGIARPVELKLAYGEFAVRLPYGEDWIDVDPAWRARNVVTRRVPLLGAVTCHRAVIAPLRRALGALERRGLGRLVDPGDFAGCYAPRRIPGTGSLSLHAFGAAVDLNASANPQFARSRQDRRLVRAMEREGFTWGGRWPTAPDPMHFELQPAP